MFAEKKVVNVNTDHPKQNVPNGVSAAKGVAGNVENERAVENGKAVGNERLVGNAAAETARSGTVKVTIEM